MLYTVGEMAQRIGIPASTLRYYDQQGLLPFVERSHGGVRMFREEDYEWLQIIQCLKKTGMPLKNIRAFVLMAMQGDATIDARLDMMLRQRDAVQRQMQELAQTLETLEFKCWYYQTARAAGTTDVPRSMTDEQLPPQFRKVRKRLRAR